MHSRVLGPVRVDLIIRTNWWRIGGKALVGTDVAKLKNAMAVAQAPARRFAFFGEV